MTKKKTTKSKIFSMTLAVIAVVLTALAFSVIGDVLFGSLDAQSVKISIPQNPNPAIAARELKQNEVIKYPLVFRLLSSLKGANDRYYGGEFVIKKGTGYVAIINGLTYRSGYKTTNITIKEGATLKEIVSIVADTGYVSEEEFTKALDESYDYDFLKDIEGDNVLEGYLFPDTYNISNQMSSEQIIKLMLDRFDEVFTDEYEKAAKELGYSNHEIITLASIIESEAATQTDRHLVSGVFHNRLKSNKYPYLESCATVQYILGERKAVLSNSDIKIKSPYNTYINKGLPIGPICSPGKASIEAALYPEDTDYYFFQSDENGKIYYAKTLTEHEKIKKKIQTQ